MALVLRGWKKARELCAGDWIEFWGYGGPSAWLEVKSVEFRVLDEMCWVAIWGDYGYSWCPVTMGTSSTHSGSFAMHPAWLPCDACVQVAREEMD